MKVNSKKVLNNLKSIRNIKILEDWSFMCAGELLNISRNMVPFDTSVLSKSGGVNETQKGHITFYDTKYAKKQHEINYNHRNGRTWKYLETPLFQNINKWKEFQKDIFKNSIKNSIN